MWNRFMEMNFIVTYQLLNATVIGYNLSNVSDMIPSIGCD